MNFGGNVRLSVVRVSILLAIILTFLLYVFVDKPISIEQKISLKHLLAASIYAANEGGEHIKILRDTFSKKSKGKTKEGMNDIVTDADYRSHCLMYYSLKFNFPTLKIVSEEVHPVEVCQREGLLDNEKIVFNFSEVNMNILTDVYVPSRDITVWIDPLDATQEFTEHLTKYVTTMVCVAVKGRPVIGVIHQPFDNHSTSSWAWVQHGMSADLKYPRISDKKTHLDYPIIIVSRSHTGLVENVLRNTFPKANITFAGGAGYKILQLIKGKASAYVHTTEIKKWDICAGDAILRAVGGRLSTLQNKNIDYWQAEDKVNKDGLLASFVNHQWFYERLRISYSF